MAFKFTRKKTIISIIVAIVVLGGATFAVVTFLLPAKTVTETPAAPQTHAQAIAASREKVTTLLAAGDDKSKTEAKKIVDEQVTTANATQDDDYIVQANIEKANFLLGTDQAQQALDDVLLPLATKYESNAKYKGTIYASISVAYTQLGDTDKAGQYLSQLSGRGN